ncbi:4764_t:CDS:2, partial [Cetraspora pellucida]
NVNEKHIAKTMSNTNGKIETTNCVMSSTQTSIREPTDLGTQVPIEESGSEETNRRKSLEALATVHSYIGSHSRCTRPTEDVFNPEDRKIRE